jgi:hypothetical protein
MGTGSEVMPMPKRNLGSMSVESLLKLRDDIGKELNRKAIKSVVMNSVQQFEA